MNFNAEGMRILKACEGCKLTAYQDKGGVWTIGWGRTEGVSPGMTCTEAQAEEWLLAEIQSISGALSKLITVPVNENQFSALVDFAYNEGTGRLSGSSILRLLNAGQYATAADHFALYDKETVNGEKVIEAGLVRRRALERALFLSPVSETHPEPPLPAA